MFPITTTTDHKQIDIMEEKEWKDHKPFQNRFCPHTAELKREPWNATSTSSGDNVVGNPSNTLGCRQIIMYHIYGGKQKIQASMGNSSKQYTLDK